MQQKEVKICGGVGRGSGGCLLHRKSLRLAGAFAMTNAQKCRPAKDAGSDTCVFVPTRCKPFFGVAVGLPEKSPLPPQVFWGVTGETVVLLSKGMVDTRKVKVDFSLEDMDLSEFTGKATYGQIKTYVLEQTGLKVSSLYIAQIKKKCGLHVGENFNLPKSDNARQPQCTPEKEDAIMQAFRHFGII